MVILALIFLYLSEFHCNFMYFIENVKKLRDYYYEIERQFIEISRIIPIDDKQLGTYSPRFYDILQTACGLVENLLRLICDEMELKYEKRDFPSYYHKLNETGILERQQIHHVPSEVTCLPFVLDILNKPPFWWRAYNDTKHNLPEGYKQGNLKNTIFALSGVYALLCVASYVQHYKKDILDSGLWMEAEAISLNTLKPATETDWIISDIRPRSKIFYPISYFRELGGL